MGSRRTHIFDKSVECSYKTKNPVLDEVLEGINGGEGGIRTLDRAINPIPA